MEKTTSGMAVAGVTYPAWQHGLDQAGAVAASLVPILSALWLAVQLVVYVRKQWRVQP